MEKAADTTQTKIRRRIHRQFGGDGAVVTPKDFLDIMSRDAVDQALARLVQKGVLDRVGRGLYHMPHTNPRLGITVPPDPNKVVDAIARQTGSPVVPSLAATANKLGISTQIPAKLVYLTTGRSRDIKVGGQNYRLKRVVPSNLPDADTLVGQALQAIKAAGPDPDPKSIAIIKDLLSPKQCKDLTKRARYASAWVAKTARQIAQPNTPPSAANKSHLGIKEE